MSEMIERQAAIDAVDAIGHIATMPDGDKCIRRSAVKYTLSMLPSAQTVATDTNVGNNSEIPNSSDCISRQAAIDALDCISGVEEVLRSLPPAQPTGRWIYRRGMNEQCSVCGQYFPLSYFKDRPFDIKYCPHCGAKMKGAQPK